MNKIYKWSVLVAATLSLVLVGLVLKRQILNNLRRKKQRKTLCLMVKWS